MAKQVTDVRRLTKDVELETRTEDWCGNEIRFVNVDGEWMAVLHDVALALNMKGYHLSERIPDSEMLRVPIKRMFDHKHDIGLTDVVVKKPRANIGKSIRISWMIVISEAGVYRALMASRKLEARKFVTWTTDVLKKLRKHVGLEGYEVFRMTEPDIQDEIDWMLDSIYYDDETGKVMQSVTLPGGDVDQVEL